MWTSENYQKAIFFAGQAHAGQLFPGSQASYVVHLAEVAMEIQHAWAMDPGDWDADFTVQCALLHDCIEDTDIGFADIEAKFGIALAQAVQALSKNNALPKSERMLDSLRRIQDLARPEVAMVKLADRITNLQCPPDHWDQAKIAKYQQEADVILAHLGHANDYLATKLQNKIREYSRFLGSP